MSELDKVRRVLNSSEGIVSSSLQRKGVLGEMGEVSSISFDTFLQEAAASQAYGQRPSSIDNPLQHIAQVAGQTKEAASVSSFQPQANVGAAGEVDIGSIDPYLVQSGRVSITPFQLFLDKAVELLENVSTMERRVDDLTDRYIKGEVSIDEVSLEATKLNLAVSFVTTVITTASQTFKELTQMQI